MEGHVINADKEVHEENANRKELEKEVYRFLIVGKTGSGKSATGNTILGTQEGEHFATCTSFMSVTHNCELKRATDNGRTIEIMDSPECFDVTRSNDDISKTIVQAVDGMHPGPHAVLFVIKIDRFTDEDYATYEKFKAVFDDDITKYVIIIFTGGDNLEREGKTMEDMELPSNLQQVMEECQRRFVVFNNRADDKKPQVEKLLELVKSVQKQNGGLPYSCSKYGHVQMALKEEVSIQEESVTKITEEEKIKFGVERIEDDTKVTELSKKLADLETQERKEMQMIQQEDDEPLVELRENMQGDNEQMRMPRDSLMLYKIRKEKQIQGKLNRTRRIKDAACPRSTPTET